MRDEVKYLFFVKFVDLFGCAWMLDVDILLPQSFEEGQEAANDVKGVEILQVYSRVINIHEFLGIREDLLRRSLS